MNTQTYVINIRAGSAIAPKVKVSQGDVGRILSFKIFDGAFAFTPAQGSTVTITGTKPSGLGFTETCTLSGNTATVSTTLDMTQESGDMLAELRIANGSASIGSVNFVLSVERAPHQDGTTDGTYETMDDIQTQIGDLSELATSEKSSLVGAINEAAQSGGSEITVDDTLTTAGAAADAKKTGDEISQIKADLEDLDDRVEALESGGGGSGLTEAVKTALLQLAQKVAYIDDDGQDYYDDLYDALYPPADLVSISAVYTQSGTVYDTDTLNDLKSDLVVTAHYSDSTTGVVTGYTLSGTLTEGTSTITVTYGGQTTTFTVTVSHVKQVVRHYFSNLEYTDGKLIKTNKSQVSVSNSGHVVIPYVQGMTVVTVMPSNWIGNYPAIMKDNGTSYSNANAVQGETVSSNTFIYSQTFDDESGIENIVTNFQSTYISQCYYETEE